MISRPTDVRLSNYAQLVQIWSNQINQDRDNGLVRSAWLQTASNWKLKADRDKDLGLPMDPAPALPVMTIYHDDGTQEHPLFPDLKVPALDNTPSTSTGGFHPTGQVIPPDRLDTVLTLLNILFTDVEAIKAKVGA